MADTTTNAETGIPSSPISNVSEPDDNVIFVGRKPSMAYVLGVITQFNDGKPEVLVKARGKAISRAVDVAEIVRRKFLTDVRIKNIDIGWHDKRLVH